MRRSARSSGPPIKGSQMEAGSGRTPDTRELVAVAVASPPTAAQIVSPSRASERGTPPSRRSRATRPPPLQLGVVIEDRLLEAPELRPRLESELLVERPPGIGVHRECLGLPPGAVEGEHQLSTEALAQRVAPHERPQLPHQLGVAAERDVGVDSQLDRLDPLLVEPGDGLRGERLPVQVGEGTATPEGERLAQRARRFLRRVAFQMPPPRVAQRSEAAEVDLALGGSDDVSGRAGEQHLVRAERLAQA